MNPDSFPVIPPSFSNCSISDFNKITSQLSCLANIPNMTQTGPYCGNGIVEDSEICDCGILGVCRDPCCNARTCQLAADCISGECCNIDTCRFHGSEKVCRFSGGECDLQETCMGNSNTCPPDAYRMNGSPCSYGSGYCYNGQCPTRASQCKAAWSSKHCGYELLEII